MATEPDSFVLTILTRTKTKTGENVAVMVTSKDKTRRETRAKGSKGGRVSMHRN